MCVLSQLTVSGCVLSQLTVSLSVCALLQLTVSVCALSRLTVSMCALSQLTVSVRALSLLTVSVCVRVCFVAVHYNAYHELEDEPFDSTRLRREIMKFRLGCGGSDSDVCLDDLVFF